MGMFDEVQCDYQLPDGYVGAGYEFQTKSFPEPSLDRFRITAEGRLVDRNGIDREPDGYITFYSARKGPGDSFIEYRAHFRDGALVDITRLENPSDPSRHFGLASFRYIFHSIFD